MLQSETSVAEIVSPLRYQRTVYCRRVRCRLLLSSIGTNKAHPGRESALTALSLILVEMEIDDDFEMHVDGVTV
jgi:hypothetical protein